MQGVEIFRVLKWIGTATNPRAGAPREPRAQESLIDTCGD